MAEVTSMSQDIQSLGLTAPAAQAARTDVWEFIFHPNVTPDLRQARVRELKALEEKFLGRRVYKRTETTGPRGTVLYIKPASGTSRMYSHAAIHSGFEVYIRFSKSKGVYVNVGMIEVDEPGR